MVRPYQTKIASQNTGEGNIINNQSTEAPEKPIFSLFENCRSSKPKDVITLGEFVEGVQKGRWRSEVEHCRDVLATLGKAKYQKERDSVLAVMLSAKVKHRRTNTTLAEKEAVHSGLLQLDFDAKDHPGQTVDEIRAIVEEAPFVIACFLSLSGEGIKAIARCPADFESHQGSWLAANAYFVEQGLTLDVCTKSPTCLCYVTFDPEATLWDEVAEIVPLEVSEGFSQPEERVRSGGNEDPEHVNRVLKELAEQIGPYQKRADWIHIVAATVDAAGLEAGCEIVDQYFPPEQEGHQCARDVAKSLTGSWMSLRKFGVEPMDHRQSLPDLTREAEEDDNDEGQPSPPHVNPMLVWGVNSFPVKVPPETVLLGNSWLRRTDIATLISTAGAGKSVGVIQAAMAWALGLPYFGIRPHHPLRVLLFSGEDDRVTMGQCRDGFLAHSQAITGVALTPADLDPLDSMLRTEFCREYAGSKFHTYLSDSLSRHPADVVIINPLLSYIGGEVVANASEWLRTGLMPVLQRHDCAALIAHHTGKMAKDGWDNTDDTYAGIGGGEIANIPRTILVLRPTAVTGLSVLKVCKRKTTGWKDQEANFTTSYFVKQSNNPELPAWIPVSHSEAIMQTAGRTSAGGNGKSRKATSAHVVAILQAGPMKQQDLIRSIMKTCDCSDNPAKSAIKDAEFNGFISADTEKNPNGGHRIKWLRLAEAEEQGLD